MERGREYKARRRRLRHPWSARSRSSRAATNITLQSGPATHTAGSDRSRSSDWRRRVASAKRSGMSSYSTSLTPRNTIAQQRERTWESFPKIIHLQKRNIIRDVFLQGEATPEGAGGTGQQCGKIPGARHRDRQDGEDDATHLRDVSQGEATPQGADRQQAMAQHAVPPGSSPAAGQVTAGSHFSASIRTTSHAPAPRFPQQVASRKKVKEVVSSNSSSSKIGPGFAPSWKK